MLDIEKLKTEYEPYVIRMRRYFHAHPELSGKELKTSAAIRAELDADGIEWRSCGKSLPQGTLGTIKGDLPGKTILLRSDIHKIYKAFIQDNRHILLFTPAYEPDTFFV